MSSRGRKDAIEVISVLQAQLAFEADTDSLLPHATHSLGEWRDVAQTAAWNGGQTEIVCNAITQNTARFALLPGDTQITLFFSPPAAQVIIDLKDKGWLKRHRPPPGPRMVFHCCTLSVWREGIEITKRWDGSIGALSEALARALDPFRGADDRVIIGLYISNQYVPVLKALQERGHFEAHPGYADMEKVRS